MQKNKLSAKSNNTVRKAKVIALSLLTTSVMLASGTAANAGNYFASEGTGTGTCPDGRTVSYPISNAPDGNELARACAAGGGGSGNSSGGNSQADAEAAARAEAAAKAQAAAQAAARAEAAARAAAAAQALAAANAANAATNTSASEAATAAKAAANAAQGAVESTATNAGNIATNADNITELGVTKADKTYVDSENAAQNTVITGNSADIATNAGNITALDNKKADITYVDSENAAQDAASAAESDRLNKVNADQDAASAAESDRLNKVNADQDAALEQTNLDVSNLDNRVTTEVSRLDAVDADLQNQVTTNKDTVNKRIDVMKEEQLIVDVRQDAEISRNTQGISELGYRVNDLDSKLSGGIAGAIAIAQMPTPIIAGTKMVTVGTGHFNGESAIAVGMSGSNSTGVITYKLGGSWSEEGGTSFGAGVGYSFF